MIARLTGIVTEVVGNVITLDVQGVGYEVFCARSVFENVTPGEEISIVIHTEVREDLLRLYGFIDRVEKKLFRFLTAVKGVGAKSASDIVSSIDRFDLLRAIGSGDITKLQAVKGIGKKTAERIIVELKDRVADYVNESRSLSDQIQVERGTSQDDALAALAALGFPERVAMNAIRQVAREIDVKSLDSGEIVKAALRYV